EDVEATILGHFEQTGQLRLHYDEHQVADLSMAFLHGGRPNVVRPARWEAPASAAPALPAREDFNDTLRRILASPNVCSKEWIIRQYDHEVQGGSALKPLVGVHEDGPGDASVLAPVLGSWKGFAVGCGLNPRLGNLDPYRMAANATDEAVRNVVAV